MKLRKIFTETEEFKTEATTPLHYETEEEWPKVLENQP